MGFPIVSIPAGQRSKVVSCASSYAALPWRIGPVEVIGTGGSLPGGVVTLSGASAVGTDNQATVTVPQDFPRPSSLKVNLSARDVPLSFRVELP
jgi:hypothetical protein